MTAYGVLLTLLVLDGIFLVAVVLLQAGKGGGLASMGGGSASEGVFGGRQAANFLTRSTWISGGTFMFLALILAILSSRVTQPSSVLEDAIPQPTGITTPAPVETAPSEATPPSEGGDDGAAEVP